MDRPPRRIPRPGWAVAGLCLLPLVLLAGLCGGGRPALAVEGGVSHYTQGAYGDFLMAYIPGPGTFIRSDTVYQAGHLDGGLRGGRIYAGIDQATVMNFTTLTRLAEVPAIGGFLGFGFGVPVIFNEHVTGDVAASLPARARRSGMTAPRQVDIGGGGDRGGLSDIYLMPIIAAWNLGTFHVTITPMVFLPTGYYSTQSLTSLGMNYVTFDGNVAVTWLGASGCEVSVNAGYMINTENLATRYLSGNQLHVDWTLAYHVGQRLALGAVGYLVAQTTPDSGPGADLGGFFSSGAGLGPAVTGTLPVMGREVTLVAKWLHGLGARRSFVGDTVYASLILGF